MSELKAKVVEELLGRNIEGLTEGTEQFETVVGTVLENIGTEEDIPTEVTYALEDEGLL